MKLRKKIKGVKKDGDAATPAPTSSNEGTVLAGAFSGKKPSKGTSFCQSIFKKFLGTTASGPAR